MNRLARAMLALTAAAFLFAAAACTTNNYDYSGVPLRHTPYDDLYRRIERHLERRQAELPSPIGSVRDDQAGPA